MSTKFTTNLVDFTPLYRETSQLIYKIISMKKGLPATLGNNSIPKIEANLSPITLAYFTFMYSESIFM